MALPLPSIRVLFVLDQTITMDKLDIKTITTNFCESLLDEVSSGDILGVFVVNSSVYSLYSLQRIKHKYSDVSWIKGTMMDWEIDGTAQVHRGLEYACKVCDSHKSTLGPTIIVVITDGSKASQSSTLTSKRFLDYLYSKYSICRNEPCKIFICMSTDPKRSNIPNICTDPVGNKYHFGTIPKFSFYKNNLLSCYFLDLSTSLSLTKSKWIMKKHLHKMKATQYKNSLNYFKKPKIKLEKVKGQLERVKGLRPFPPGLLNK